VYGYIDLAAGLGVALLVWSLRSRVPLIFLALLPLVYIGLRLGGAWDARGLTVLADRLVGRGGTVAFRLAAEDEWVAVVLRGHAMLGLRSYPWHSLLPNRHWPDGWWIISLWTCGLVGLAVHFGALFLVPAELAITVDRAATRVRRAPPAAWGLACLLLVHQLNALHNWLPIIVTGVVGGTLVGAYMARLTSADREARETARYRIGAHGAERVVDTSRATPVLARASLLSLVLVSPEIFTEVAARVSHADAPGPAAGPSG
jgi:hypothetical protein